MKGNATTDYGAPGAPTAADERPLNGAELERQSSLLQACWNAFDAAWSRASAGEVELRLGPRGGGRDLPKIEAHVREAEEAYLGPLGSRNPRLANAIAAERMAALRIVVLATLEARATGAPIADPSQTKRSWPPRFFVRRSAWHALDHAWEIEDRSIPG